MKLFAFYFGVYVVCATLDIVSTWLSVQLAVGGELNPFIGDFRVQGLVLHNIPVAILVGALAAVASFWRERFSRYLVDHTFSTHLRYMGSFQRYKDVYLLRFRVVPTGVVDEIITSIGVSALAICLAQGLVGVSNLAVLSFGVGLPDLLWSVIPFLDEVGVHLTLVVLSLCVTYPLVYTGFRQRACRRVATA